MLSRRNFLKLASIAALGSLAGCKKKGKIKVGPAQYIFEDEPKEFWEDVSPYVNNTLEGGFAFDLGELNLENKLNINGEEHFLDAQGTGINSQDKIFTITDVKRNERGVAIDMIEGDGKLQFTDSTIKNITINNKEYSIEYKGFALEEMPVLNLSVNGIPYSLEGGKGFVDGLSLHLNLLRFLREKKVELFFSPSSFSSRHHAGESHFSGLEVLVFPNNKIIEENQYNHKRQEDSYVRMDFSSDRGLTLRKVEKINIPDAPIDFFLHWNNRSRSANEYELEKKHNDKTAKISPLDLGFQDFEKDFSLLFVPPLEARIEAIAHEMSFLPQLFNASFEANGKNYLIRYVALDPRKPTIKVQKQSSLPWNIYYSFSTLYTEILENPLELILEQEQTKELTIDGETYLITHKGFDFNSEPNPALLINVKKDGLEEDVVIKTLSHGYPNHILGINIDPDVEHYWGKADEHARRGSVQKLFISKNKFSSAADFADDAQFSGLKKVLIPNYKEAFILGKPFTNTVEYQQVTLGNRLNGVLKENWGFRALADVSWQYLEKLTNDTDNAYKAIPTKGYNLSDLIKNGHIVRIKSFEKIER